MRRGRRYVRIPPDLTSLFDVLFILIFAALIRTAVVTQAIANPAPPPTPPPVKLEPSALHKAALADLDKQLAARPVVIVHVTAAGAITGLETAGKLVKIDTPLLEHSPDPDIAIAYLGDRSAEIRVCRVAALHAGVPDLSRYLVIIAPDKHLADLPHALYEGLRRDVDRCLADQQGLAVIVDPSVTEPTKQPAKDAPSP